MSKRIIINHRIFIAKLEIDNSWRRRVRPAANSQTADATSRFYSTLQNTDGETRSGALHSTYEFTKKIANHTKMADFIQLLT